MGGGTMTKKDWKAYSSVHVPVGSTAKTIYKSDKLKDEYNPLNITMRESRDSDDHPVSTPIIVGLDVTGSMHHILETVAHKLGDLVTEILNRNPVEGPQIMFNAIGDHVCDRAPLQMTQFESDIRIAEQLLGMWFERGGGGNSFESYPLAWYAAARKTVCDNFEKRGKKGFLFTMGDDGYPSYIPKEAIKEFFGDDLDEDVDVKSLLNEVNRTYEVFHLCIGQGGSHRDSDYREWQELLGERAILVSDYEKIPEIIVSILERMSGKSVDDVVKSWDGTTAIAVQSAIQDLATTVSASSKEVVEF